MRKIILSRVAQNSIIQYIQAYRKYFTDLYTDTGIFSEEQILQYYEEQTIIREREMLSLIEKSLSPDEVLWRTLQDTLFLSWRSKFILLVWIDAENNERIISDIEIR